MDPSPTLSVTMTPRTEDERREAMAWCRTTVCPHCGGSARVYYYRVIVVHARNCRWWKPYTRSAGAERQAVYRARKLA